MWLLSEHIFNGYGVRVTEEELPLNNPEKWGHPISIGIFRLEEAECSYCDGDGCDECNGTGYVPAIGQEPAFNMEDTQSMERQFKALWRRYGRVDLDSVRDMFTYPPPKQKTAP